MKFISWTAAFVCFGASAVYSKVVLNEISFDELSGSPDWVEILNTGSASESVENWIVDDVDAASGKEIVLHISTPIPPGGYLLIYVDAAGPDETDFSDGTATIYSGTGTTVSFAATEDEAVLYRSGVPSSATLVDFVSWVTDGHYDGASDQADAVAAGLWSSGTSVSAEDRGNGYSLGLIRDGRDENSTSDWRVFLRPTPGAPNHTDVRVPTEGKPFRVDPAANLFSPEDCDPGRRAARFFFQVPSESYLKFITLYDAEGRSVRVLINADGGTAGESFSSESTGIVYWDGKDDDGRLLPMGVYVAVFEAVDPGGGGLVKGRGVVALGRPRR